MAISVPTLVLVLVSFAVAGAIAQQQITSLPLYDGDLASDMYSGYVTVNATNGGNIFYWFVESENDPANDPILMWMQGGPGCAGTWGMWVEMGPYRLDPFQQSVQLNDYRWTRDANMIFIDQPAGVGFSYSDSIKGDASGDYLAAEDNYLFLQEWFKLFPSFAENDLWIVGESYGGVYVPTLVNQIVTGNDTQLSNSLTGFMVGNPVINCELPAGQNFHTLTIDNFFYHGLIGYRDKMNWYNQGCNSQSNFQCDDLYFQIMGSASPVDGDDLYHNPCTGNGTINFMETVPGCENLSAKILWYFNRQDVKEAIHAQDGLWDSCSIASALEYHKSDENMLDLYNYFFENTNLRIMVYSGDVDINTVPHPNTQACLYQLDRPITSSWRRWTVPGPDMPHWSVDPANKDITAGYVEVYDRYTYATVRAAGHEVPLYQPHFGYELFKRFLINNDATLQ